VVHLSGGEFDYGSAAVVIPELSSGVNQAVTYSGEKDLPADSWERSPVYFYGYNDSNFTRRAHEVAAAVSMAVNHPDWKVTKVTVEGSGETAAVALAAKFLTGDEIDDLAIDLDAFRFGAVTDFSDDEMVPGAVKYGDVEGLEKVATQ